MDYRIKGLTKKINTKTFVIKSRINKKGFLGCKIVSPGLKKDFED